MALEQRVQQTICGGTVASLPAPSGGKTGTLARPLVWASAALILLTATASSHAASLRLKAGNVDPSLGSVAQLASAYKGRHWIVQFARQPHDSDRRSLEASGARVIGYVPDNAYLVECKAVSVRSAVRLSGAASFAPYLAGYRIDPAAASAQQPVQARVQVFDEAGLLRLVSQLPDIHGVRLLGQGTETATVLADGNTLRRIARLEEVRWIELATPAKLHTSVARQLTGVNSAWSNVGLFGSGQTLAIADTGLDVGATSPNLSADFKGRVTAAFDLGRAGRTDDPEGHGTHVAGVAAGSGVLSGASPIGHSYTESLAGAAPEANLVIQSLLDNSGELGGIPSNLSTLFSQAYAAGARVHSDSWGSDVAGVYGSWSQQLDQHVWDHQDMVVVFSAGNEGVDLDGNGVIDPDSINAPATAKNCISVGASESERLAGGRQYPWASGSSTLLYPAEPIRSDLMSNNPNGLAAFSSRGPCDDGRIKPDIVAPGTNIVAARSHAPGAGLGWGAYNSDYVYLGGSSTATPLVAGAAAVVRQYYMTVQGQEPSASLVKATLLASAKELSPGQYGTSIYLEIPQRPNTAEGWGRLDLRAAVATPTPSALQFVDYHQGLSTGQIYSQTFQVIDPSVPLRVMLVWSDYPAEAAAAKALVNDLDLKIIPPGGGIINGNGMLDRTNNVEGITLDSPQDGEYTVQVSGYNVPEGPQSFSLVMIGGLPRTFISGLIRTMYGAQVPGVTVTAVSGNKHYSGISLSDGTYSINAPEGTYTVTPSRPGWTFAPGSRQIVVGPSGEREVDFEGSAARASVSGTIRDGVVQPLTGLLWHSPHPYENDSSEQLEIAGPPEAVRIRLHFSKIDTERGLDMVYLKSAAGNIVTSYCGLLEDHWTRWMDGSRAFVQMVTNSSGTSWGWEVDAVEVTVPGNPHPGIVLRETGGNTTALSGPDGVYGFSNLDPVPNSIRVEAPGFLAKPAARQVWPEPGSSVTGTSFVLVPEPPVAHIRINHGRVDDLRVLVGVGDPSNPLYSKVVSQYGGSNNTSLVIDAALDEATQFLPPSEGTPWFVRVCDDRLYNAGQISDFWVTKGAALWRTTEVPPIISDFTCSVLRIPAQSTASVGQAKHSYDFSPVALWAKQVTAVFPDRFYVMDESGTAGIGVNGAFPVAVGDLVTVTGTPAPYGCEKMIEPTRVDVNQPGGPAPSPMSMMNKVVGGRADEFGNPGFETPHLNNMGMLIRTTGRVTAVGTGWFYIDDGAAPDDGTGNAGVRVSADGFAPPDPGDFVTVTGISTCHEDAYPAGRLIRTRGAADVIRH